MAFDDDKIRIEVEGAQAQAQLDALAAEVRVLEKELEELNNTAGVTNAEIEGTTRRLGEAKVKFAEASASMQGFGKSAGQAGFNLRDLSKSVGAGISVVAILQENLRALEPALNKVGEALKFAAEQAGASSYSTEQAALGLDMLIHPSHIVENNIKLMANAWKGLMEEMVPSSTVITNNVKSIEESLKILEAARKDAAEKNKDAKSEEEKATKALAKEEEALEKAAIKSAEERAKAAEKAAQAVIASLEKERVALDAKLAQDEARLEKALGAGGKIDTSKDADAAKADVAALRDEIKRLENQPTLDTDQLNKLNELKDRAGKAAAAVRDLGDTFTITADDFLTESEAANAAGAAWDVYRDRIDKAAMAHEDAIRSTEDADAALSDFTETADDAAGSLEDAADAAGSIGDEAKKGTDKAKEGLAGMVEGLEEAIPLAEQLRGILQEIVTLGSQADI